MVSKKTMVIVAFLLFFGLVIPSISSAEETHQSMYEVASEDERFDTFINLAGNTGMDSELRNLSEATLFVPVNEAFDNLSAERHDLIFGQENIPELRKLIRRHVLHERINIFDLNKSDNNSSQRSVKITVEDGAHYVNGIKVMERMYEASNGVVYGIDGVFLQNF